jgi:hypothetical protein
LVKIFSGEAKGEGCYALFKPTYKYILEPQFVEIIARIHGRGAPSLSPELDVEIEILRSSYREGQETKIQLPKGFIFKLAEPAKSKVMRISTPNVNFDHSSQNGFFAQVEYRGP